MAQNTPSTGADTTARGSTTAATTVSTNGSTSVAASSSTPPDFAAVKQRQQAAWSSGDYGIIGVTLQMVGEALAEAADIRTNERVIDIAAGNGNATLAAARRGAHVTSTDYVPQLLEKGRARAAAEGLAIDFREADAEHLPFADGAFDVALSTFGIMFTPDHAQAAHEMVRVVREGGRIGMANWTPDGFIGQLFKVLGAHVPPAPGVQPPSLWGTENHLRTLFGPHVAHMELKEKIFNFRYASAAHWLHVFRTYYGPLNKAFGALDANGQQALERDVMAVLDRFNIAGPASFVGAAAYLEVVMTRRADTVH